MKLLQLCKKILIWKVRLLASWTLKRYKPTVIGVTGSAGKTSSKEAIFAVLRKEYVCRRNVKNFNNELGVPLTILGDYQQSGGFFFWLKAILKGYWHLIIKDKKYPEVLILEMAADRPGDIKYLTNLTKPHVGVITAIGDVPVHVEFYSSPEAVVREKGKMIESLPEDGFAILNFDDERVWELKNKTRAKIFSFGFNQGADIQIGNMENRMEDGRPEGIAFKVQYGGSFVPVRLNKTFGKPQAYAAAAAISVGIVFGLHLVEISDALSEYEAPEGRMKLIDGVKKTLILDDSYNASPLSMIASLETLKSLPAKRKIAVLADMLEIGDYAEDAHKNVGKVAAEVVNHLFCIGPRAHFIAESALKAGLDSKKVQVFDNSETAKKMIEKELKQGDLVLVKGSHAMELEKVLEEIRMM
jgi:UDP-N-acetylmuramoyl-tripeptide--D-alanyl-D-alanine ligase